MDAIPSVTTDLTLYDNAKRALSELINVDEVRARMNKSAAIQEYARRAGDKELELKACRYRLWCERRAGELLSEMEKNPGGNPNLSSQDDRLQTLTDLGVTRDQSSQWQQLASLAEDDFEDKITSLIKPASSKVILRESLKQEHLARQTSKLTLPCIGLFDVVIIDPPWPIEKIEREVRPNQGKALDYPIMTLDQIRALEIPASDHCHIFLWTTQRFLPESFNILESWKFRYVCTFVWHKPGGFKPFGLPQYNAEFCLYARHGAPEFIDTKEFFTCFSAPRAGHSKKPGAFYDVIRRVTEGKRIDMFNRRPIEGFVGWGYESNEL